MQIVENWAMLIGLILAVLPSEDRPDYYEMQVRIEAIEPVDSFPMLVHADKDATLTVLVRRSQIDAPDAAEGASVKLRVRAAGPAPLTYFAGPEWVFTP